MVSDPKQIKSQAKQTVQSHWLSLKHLGDINMQKRGVKPKFGVQGLNKNFKTKYNSSIN